VQTETTPAPSKAESQAQTDPLAAKSISVTRAGNPDGRTVVLIPGLASSKDVWDGTVAALSDYDLRVVQVAGFAGAAPIDAMSADKITTDISAYLKETPGKNTVVIGHSLGGFIALKTGLDHGDQVDELIIVDSLPYLAGLYMPEATPDQAAAMSKQMTKQLASLPRSQFDAQQEAGLARLTNNPDAISELADWGKTSDQQTVAKMMGELISTDMRDELSDLSVKTTVLMPYAAAMGLSEKDLKKFYVTQYEKAPNVTVKVIPDSFHFIMLDQPDAFYDVVKAELSD
jgi:pimeloyl-ACP methyl ester carboxylesterase